MFFKKLISVILILLTVFVLSAFSFDINNGDNVSIFDDVVIPEGTVVTGDAVTIFGKTEIRGTVRGDVVTVFGKNDIYGEVGGDVVTVFGKTQIAANAIVGGDIVGVMGKVEKDNGAVIRGEVVDISGGNWYRDFDIVPRFGTDAASVASMIINFALACLVVLVVPERVAFMEKSCQVNILRSFGIGILVMLGVLLLVPALMITIIGIIPAVLLVIGFVIVAFVSMTAIYIALGRKIAAAVEGKNAVYIHLLIGLVIVSALQMIPIVGFLAGLAVFFVALGVAFDTRVGKPLMRKTQV